jgi:hypothetical protein
MVLELISFKWFRSVAVGSTMQAGNHVRNREGEDASRDQERHHRLFRKQGSMHLNAKSIIPSVSYPSIVLHRGSWWSSTRIEAPSFSMSAHSKCPTLLKAWLSPPAMTGLHMTGMTNKWQVFTWVTHKCTIHSTPHPGSRGKHHQIIPLQLDASAKMTGPIGFQAYFRPVKPRK